jgi:large subunit ribosomal protein L9
MIEKKVAALRKQAMTLKEKLEQVSITIARQTGEEEKIFGSVTTRDIAHALSSEGIELDHRAILLEKPIKQLGSYNIDVKLHNDVRANLRVWVVKE